MNEWPTGSLFSGIGGLDLGLERAGMEIRWESEIDPLACRVLVKHWPSVPNLGDVTLIDWSTVERVRVLCGGYPCQPFSNNGLRRGHDDERHLWPEFASAIRLLRPEYVIAENVPGHLSLGFDRVLADLASLGFDAEWSIVPACALGAPHTRERLCIVAHSESNGRDREWDQARAQAGGCRRSVDRELEGPGAPARWAAVPRPRVLGMAHGVPTELDRARLKAHGNAVVPAVAEFIGRRVVEAKQDEG